MLMNQTEVLIGRYVLSSILKAPTPKSKIYLISELKHIKSVKRKGGSGVSRYWSLTEFGYCNHSQTIFFFFFWKTIKQKYTTMYMYILDQNLRFFIYKSTREKHWYNFDPEIHYTCLIEPLQNFYFLTLVFLIT